MRIADIAGPFAAGLCVSGIAPALAIWALDALPADLGYWACGLALLGAAAWAVRLLGRCERMAGDGR